MRQRTALLLLVFSTGWMSPRPLFCKEKPDATTGHRLTIADLDGRVQKEEHRGWWRSVEGVLTTIGLVMIGWKHGHGGIDVSTGGSSVRLETGGTNSSSAPAGRSK